MSITRAALGLAALSFLALAARPAAANTAIGFTANASGTPDSVSDDNGAFGASNSSYVAGWSFTVGNAPITVTSLGWDYYSGFVNQDGTAAPDGTHEVGLFDNTGGTELTSATVSYDGTDGFSYAAAKPALLAANATYTIAGVTGLHDPFFLSIEDTMQPGNVGLVVDQALTYNQDQVVVADSLSGVGPSLVQPTSTDAGFDYDPAFFGPNFQFTQGSPAPEPSQIGMLALLGLSLGGLLWKAHRRA